MNERPADQQPPVQQQSVQQQRRVEQGTIGEEQGSFLPDDRMSSLRERWTDVQAAFVDNPQQAVQEAHQLVADLVNQLTQMFTQERTNLESQWKGGGDADTEALRIALQRYRSFFNRLLGT